MDTLDQFRIFAKVAEMSSFTKAAHILNMPRATISIAIQSLESNIGTKLFYRTTRRVSLTTDGAMLLEHVCTLLENAETINTLFRTNQQQVSGRLNIEAPSRIARRLIAPALPILFEQYPNLSISLGSSDRFINLFQDGVDCAIRVGNSCDSSLEIKPIGHLLLINCCSPEYLNKYGMPKSTDILHQNHLAVGYASPTTGIELPWEYVSSDQAHTLIMPSKVTVNNAESYIACCLSGLGLIQIPKFDVQDLLRTGELVEIMPHARAQPMKISFVYPKKHHHSPRLNAFINWAEDLLQPYLD
ncbi:LysR family transcriptional regulator [Chromobacterium haemolyticum]|uniref:LysR family transcriptional regulator n=1 Tax=Chromobacterium fluminis TaxID=3044269 RepID=A0ABX0L6H6_9NEIS|nr:LysR family transcriptional regulator [Chromobacterium haemolyticum]NHR07234.1 LysR family transcriptional regulator [Chromobacterium haemolyticum]